MNIEEKRYALIMYCEGRGCVCDGCPLKKSDGLGCFRYPLDSYHSDYEIDELFEKLCVFKAETGNLNVSASCIKDSGARREFETGAVRDIQEGKGRCDLLPLDVVAHVLREDECGDQVLLEINHFKETGCDTHLYMTLDMFVLGHPGWEHAGMILEVSKHFEEGAKKYGEYNWQKGIPVHCYIDSAVRHYLKFLRGDTDEPHDRAFVWNILCCIWTCIHKPELNEYKKKEESNK